MAKNEVPCRCISTGRWLNRFLLPSLLALLLNKSTPDLLPLRGDLWEQMCTIGVCSQPSLPAYSELNLRFSPPSAMSGAIHSLFLPHLPTLRGSVQTEAPERRAEQDSTETAQLAAPHILSPLPKKH